MATADTARLIALLELQDKFTEAAGERRARAGQLRAQDGHAGPQGAAVRPRCGNAAANVGDRYGRRRGRHRLLAVNVKKGVDSLNELENVTVATNTVLKSTDGVSGQTADGIRELAEEYEDLNATMDDKVIQSGANMLLTFTNIREEAFEPALEAALNLNEAMGGGPEACRPPSSRSARR